MGDLESVCCLLFVYFICLFVYLFICYLFICLFCLFICFIVCFHLLKIEISKFI